MMLNVVTILFEMLQEYVEALKSNRETQLVKFEMRWTTQAEDSAARPKQELSCS